jgi:hypothetical protein
MTCEVTALAMITKAQTMTSSAGNQGSAFESIPRSVNPPSAAGASKVGVSTIGTPIIAV